MAYPTLDATSEVGVHPAMHNAYVDAIGHFGAIGDDSADNETQLNNGLSALASMGGGKLFIGPGVFQISGSLFPLASNLEICGAGIDATVLKITNANPGGAGDAIRTIKTVPYYHNIAIRDLTIDCSLRTTLPYSNGITMQGVDFATIERVKIISPLGFGIVIGTDAGGTPYADGATIRDVTIIGERNGNDSIGGGGLQRSLIENYHCYDPAGTGLDLTNCDRVNIRNCYVRNTLTITGAMWGISSDFGWENVTVENCHVEGSYYGIFVGSTASGQAKNIRILNNRIHSTDRAGIWLDSTSAQPFDGFTIADNKVTDYDIDGVAVPGVLVVEGRNGFIYGNDVQGVASAYAMRLASAGGGTGTKTTKVFGNILDATNPLSFQAADGGLVDNTVTIRDNRNFNPQGAASITVTASPFTYTNNDNVAEAVYIRSGTVSVIAKNSRTIFVTTDQTVWLEPGEAVVVTYSSAPTMEKDRK